jgi:hypothetical protein
MLYISALDLCPCPTNERHASTGTAKRHHTEKHRKAAKGTKKYKQKKKSTKNIKKQT